MSKKCLRVSEITSYGPKFSTCAELLGSGWPWNQPLMLRRDFDEVSTSDTCKQVGYALGESYRYQGKYSAMSLNFPPDPSLHSIYKWPLKVKLRSPPPPRVILAQWNAKRLPIKNTEITLGGGIVAQSQLSYWVRLLPVNRTCTERLMVFIININAYNLTEQEFHTPAPERICRTVSVT